MSFLDCGNNQDYPNILVGMKVRNIYQPDIVGTIMAKQTAPRWCDVRLVIRWPDGKVNSVLAYWLHPHCFVKD